MLQSGVYLPQLVTMAGNWWSIACHGGSSLHQFISKAIHTKVKWYLVATLCNFQLRMVAYSLGASLQPWMINLSQGLQCWHKLWLLEKLMSHSVPI